MGQIEFTSLQKTIFEKLIVYKDVSSQFYFTGGTALSVFYLHHRFSFDLDFFSEKDFADELVIKYMSDITSSLNLTSRYTKRANARIFELVKNKEKVLLKVDFVYHPFKQLRRGEKFKGFFIDSLIDIGANKLLTVNQRTDVKDFVDLYFLLKKFTIWDLIYAIEAKYRLETDIILLASDFLKVEDFSFLPEMILSLKLSDLKKFFRQKAKELGRKVVV